MWTLFTQQINTKMKHKNETGYTTMIIIIIIIMIIMADQLVKQMYI